MPAKKKFRATRRSTTATTEWRTFSTAPTSPSSRAWSQPWRPDLSVLDSPEAFGYKVFTRAYDEIVNAEELCEADELERLRAPFSTSSWSRFTAPSRDWPTAFSAGFAQQNRGWDFDLDEGMIDAARLSRVIVDPMPPLTYKQERDTQFRDTVVTLLLDNSGSMPRAPDHGGGLLRRYPRARSSAAASRSGFSATATRAWKGGHAREAG